MVTQTKIDRSVPRGRPLGAADRFARTPLLMGWLLFALFTLLSQCLEAVAAPPSEAAQNITESPAGTAMGIPTQTADDDTAPSCHLPPCIAVSRSADDLSALRTNYSPSGEASSATIASPSPAALNGSLSSSQYEAPPPAHPLYLRTLRLLI